MNKVLVTGGTGFIGQRLVQHLLAQHVAVRILVRKPETAPLGVDVVVGDITDAASLSAVCDGIDTVFHLAGYAHADAAADPTFAVTHHTVNYLGTKNIMAQAIQAKVQRFIFFSTVKAVAESEQCINEQWDGVPQSPYGVAKRAAEQCILEIQRTTAMHVCILRPSLVYGPAWKGNLASMMQAIDRGKFPPLPETHNQRSMVSVDDICRAALLAAKHPNANGKIYFVTDGVSYSTQTIYSLMRFALGKMPAKWHVPLWIFRGLALIGDWSSRLLRRQMLFTSDTFKKLFGSAQYDSRRITEDLGFMPLDNFQTVLPVILHGLQK